MIVGDGGVREPCWAGPSWDGACASDLGESGVRAGVCTSDLDGVGTWTCFYRSGRRSRSWIGRGGCGVGEC